VIPSSGIKERHEATEFYDKLAADSLEMLIQWLKEDGNVGIHGSSH
jgi:6-phosphofructo-2-kinase/fructose-2,6-biphosphatase 2